MTVASLVLDRHSAKGGQAGPGTWPVARSTTSPNLAGCAVANTTPGTSGLSVGHQPCIPHGGVGTHHVARPVQHLFHDFARSRIVQARALDLRPQRGQISAIQGFQPRAVGRVTHVHGVAQGRDRRTRLERLAVQEGGESAVVVGRGHKPGVGHAHLGCKHAGGQIPHVA